MISLNIKRSGNLAQALQERLAEYQNTPTLRAGFLETETYPDGTPVAQVAFWQEYGTKTIPPRPFFRPTIAQKQAGWGVVLSEALQHTQGNIKQSLGILGEQIKDDITQSIVSVNSPALSPVTLWMRKLRGAGRDRKPFEYAMLIEARKRAAAGELPSVNSHPLIDTNQMVEAIGWDLEG